MGVMRCGMRWGGEPVELLCSIFVREVEDETCGKNPMFGDVWGCLVKELL